MMNENQNQMNENEREFMLHHGFVPPIEGWRKLHPKGEKFGYFEVSDLSMDGGVRVFKFSSTGQLEWVCTFDNEPSFKNWVKNLSNSFC